jgi:hypothetical protein
VNADWGASVSRGRTTSQRRRRPIRGGTTADSGVVVTTGLAGGSHVWHRNIDWPLFKRLAPAGVAGGILGAYTLVGLPEQWVKFFITLYLIAITHHRAPHPEGQSYAAGHKGGARTQATNHSNRRLAAFWMRSAGAPPGSIPVCPLLIPRSSRIIPCYRA